jgi:hypothetical protein
MTSSSIEFDDGAADIASRAALEKALLMVVAILAAFALREAGLRGQRWIAARFDRGDYDYRRASQLLGEVMATRLDLEGLAAGVVETLTSLMPVKRTAVLLAQRTRPLEAPPDGFDLDAWMLLRRVDARPARRTACHATFAPHRIRVARCGARSRACRSKSSIRSGPTTRFSALLVGEKRLRAPSTRQTSSSSPPSASRWPRPSRTRSYETSAGRAPQARAADRAADPDAVAAAGDPTSRASTSQGRRSRPSRSGATTSTT